MGLPVVEWGLSELFGCILIAITSIFAASIGLGGGSLFVAILQVLMNYTTHEATALSQSMMAGSSLAILVQNLRLRHPLVDRPLLNLELVLLIVPFLLASTISGVIINRLIPPYAIIIILTFVMVWSLYNTFKRAILLYKEEKSQKKKGIALSTVTIGATEFEKNKKEVLSMEEGTEQTTKDGDYIESNSNLEESERENTSSDDKNFGSSGAGTARNDAQSDFNTLVGKGSPANEIPARDANMEYNPFTSVFMKRSKSFFAKVETKQPLSSWGFLVAVWMVNFLFSFFRGSGEGTIDLIDACGVEYWLMVGCSIALLILAGSIWAFYTIARTQRKIVVGSELVKGDIVYTPRVTSILLLTGFTAGLYGGTVGVGGSMIVTPGLLYFGCLPQVVVGITATVIFMSSSAAATIFLSGGMVPLDVAAVLGAITFCFAFAGKYYLDKWVKERNSPSTILFIFVVFLVVSIAAFAAATIYKMIIGETDSGGIDLLCLQGEYSRE